MCEFYLSWIWLVTNELFGINQTFLLRITRPLCAGSEDKTTKSMHTRTLKYNWLMWFVTLYVNGFWMKWWGWMGVDCSFDLSLIWSVNWYVVWSYNPSKHHTCTKPVAHMNASALLWVQSNCFVCNGCHNNHMHIANIYEWMIYRWHEAIALSESVNNYDDTWSL